MRLQFKRFSDLFNRLAEFWSTSPAVRTLRRAQNIIWQSFLITLCVFVIGAFFAVGTASGYFAKLVRNQPVLSYSTLNKDINSYSESSESYFAGNIPIGKMNSDLIRTKTQLSDISPNLTHAVVAIEDELYYQHHGVVPKAVIRASLEQFLHEPQVSGGSSITQQLVKNQVLNSQVTIDRKFKEILLAMRVEKFFNKDQILESYLNMAPFGRDSTGRNVAGASAAAEGIFNVSADKLNIPQAAFLAGLPKNPFTYTPFKNRGGLKSDVSAGISRAHTVLQRMYATGYINKAQLDSALKYDYRKHFSKPGKVAGNDYPYLSQEVEKRATIILAEKLASQEGYNGSSLYNDYQNYTKMLYEESNNVYKGKSLAQIAKVHGYNLSDVKNHYQLFSGLMNDALKDLQYGGYKIYTTINKSIYDDMQTVAQNYNGYSPDKTITVSSSGKQKTIKDSMQVGSVLIDNKTGKIISFVGGRGFQISQYNYATEVTRQNGSTMKPLLVYAPSMELGLIQPGSIVADLPYKRTVNGQSYQPTDYGSTATTKLFHGFETVRTALALSHNVPAVDTFTRLSLATNKAPDYLKEMGITSLVGSDGYNVSAALGGITKGVTVEENTDAYTTFANNGNFVDAYMIDKIIDGKGTVVYQHQTKPVQVFTPQTSYLMLDMMRDVFKYGTGRSLSGLLDFSADWAGKTGTSQNWRDSWLVASNPNITMGVWNGYSHNSQLDRYAYSTQTRQLWAGFANAAYRDDPELMAPKTGFTQPQGISKTQMCGLTDQKPTQMCQSAGFVTTDLVNNKYLPKDNTEALEPANATSTAPQQNNSQDPNQPANQPVPGNQISSGGFRIKPEIMSSRFPYIDLKSANPKLLGKIRP
ncbi:penicillin-binding protein [Sporolactobacillus shoreae]|uniref:Penicillin-binding protein n=1 Tax=Sporolactobacillus shoreae TaxID=1465501 RepID=A0A4Z0GPU3_9BACL|nr:transglycosylase domain-containing protein [Sporolactobacillus shoreae]TGA99234.1 penicillin-binding protein [Sporolactobacillus shoreae]